MKKRMVIGSFVGLLMVGAVANAGDSDALVALDKKWGESEGTEVPQAMLSEEMIALSAAGVAAKADMLEEAANAEPATGPYVAADYDVRFLSDDVAVMVHSVGGDQPHWSMHVWQKQDGAWQVAATATVPIKE